MENLIEFLFMPENRDILYGICILVLMIIIFWKEPYVNDNDTWTPFD